ncbi:MAG: hypothetical protein M3N16_02205 [Actinomycetota bacterium]|nr:hypothetical protein [Actinomycetota bacterium]
MPDSTTAASGRGPGTSPPADTANASVGSYATYRAAERAVDRLSKHGFPVEHAAIVAHGVRLAEDVERPVRYATAALAGLAAGAFAGTAFGALDAAVDLVYPLLLTPGVAFHGLVFGAIVGVAVGLALHALSRGRSFSSGMRIAARRFDVTVDETLAREAGEILDAFDSPPAPRGQAASPGS